MKNRLLALLLCLAMMVSVLACFTACSQSEDDNTAEDILSKNDEAKTLTMWVVTENQKTDVDENGNPCFSKNVQKAMDEIEKEFTKLTKSAYKTNVDIIFLTEDEYYTELELAMTASTNVDELFDKAERALSFYLDVMNEKINNGQIPHMNKEELATQFYVDYPEYWAYRSEMRYADSSDTSSSDEDKTVLNEYGVPELKYPETEENQVDIIYISGRDKFIKYVDNEWLASLDEELTASTISSYVSPALLGGIKYQGSTYAIPNNIAIGEYTYMLVDKELYDNSSSSYEIDEDSNIIDCKDFLHYVTSSEQYSDVLPIASDFNETMSLFTWYWNIGYEEQVDSLGNTKYSYPIGDGSIFSMFGALYGNPKNATRGKLSLGFNNLLCNEEYQNILKTLKGYEYSGYYGTPVEGQRVAVSYLKGGYEIKREATENGGVYTDENGREYYVSIVKYPEVGEDELYGNMFAVCSATDSVYHCMKIIEYINTNSTARNLLQYGIEGEHYQIKSDGTLERIALDVNEQDESQKEYYLMDIQKTGNCFIAYPEEGLSADYWEDAKIQNGEAVVNPLLGFDFSTMLEDEDSRMKQSELENVLSANKWISELIDGAENSVQLEAIIETLASKLSSETATIGGYYISISKYMNTAYESESGYDFSPSTVYYKWMVENGYLPA